ncbi:uncharacterized protein LOC129779410 isoform X2 [Toxorhynchites rutilus septentrionalis]|uniref:uncharacterized protein LOC129779410 isoform X2 n=1 Tax=Toxorhynchites rutilus septentrionalis TaxID=329112 RepID=UPI002479920A|nr:uncharacterized protein LOC129779410 isoform X2 [Toxorhynchites rutilus septentrionalis]XP_055642839.1 uncharacterized protein LOC129779410 isoform X2 [Toxorhynchites rutilus septentrionalis]
MNDRKKSQMSAKHPLIHTRTPPVALGRRIGLYRFCGDIGRGNFSRVKLAVHQLTKDKVAIKVVDTSRLDAKALRMLSREVTILESVFHPFILRLFEVIETLGKIHLISEWVPGGELYNRIAEVGPLEEPHSAFIFYQLLMAVKHLHNLGYVHRDIKAENVLLVSEDRIKLADFGFSTQLINGPWQHLDTFCGSPPYAAPELFSDDHYIGGPVDIWALGVLLYFMLHSKMPFKATTVPLLRAAVLKGEFEISSSVSLPCCRVIQRILVQTPSRRPTIEQLLKSQWFEYAQASKHIVNKLGHSRDNTHSEVPITRKTHFWLFSTRGQQRQHPSTQSSSCKNTDAANQYETTVPIMRTIKCSTKRAGSVLEESFLHPLEPGGVDLNHINQLDNNVSNNNTFNYNELSSAKGRKFSFSRAVKKRISPLEITMMHNSKPSNSETSTVDFRDRLVQLIDTEHGKHVMYPTTIQSVRMHPIEKESRRLMENLGISSDILEKSVISGPRSDIIGIYRILVHRLQKEQTITSLTGEPVTVGSLPRSLSTTLTEVKPNKKNSNGNKSSESNAISCAIL